MDIQRAQRSRQEFLRDAANILQQEWQEYHLLKSCPVFFNITNFHLYNATHGFRQGDLCLQHIEGILRDVFPDRPVLHLGADNFAALAEKASAINDALHDRFRAAGISISLGFSMTTLPAANIDNVLAEADHHMYKEKILHHQTRHQHQATDA